MVTATSPTIDINTLRNLFLGTALRRSIMVTPPTAYAVGQLVTTIVPHAGLAEKIRVNCQIPVTITGTVTRTAKGPYNMFTTVRLTDYSGVDRINCSAYALYLLELLKRRAFEPSINGGGVASASTANTTDTGINTFNTGPFVSQRFNYPNTTGTVVFSFDLPISLGEMDTRGMALLTVPNGNWTLYLQCAPQLVLDNSSVATSDAPFTASGGIPATNNVTVGTAPIITVAYYYWDPIQIPGLHTADNSGVPLPYADVALIHELRGLTDASGIAASMEKLYTLPSGRDYYRFVESVNENGTLSVNHINQFRHLFDGSTPTLQEYLQPYLNRVQRELGRDLPDGTLYYDWVNRPWDANSYGQLAVGTTFTSGFTNTGNTYLEFLLESLYISTLATS